MEETIKIRKDKIKNIAIVFLSIMLILTFFSNSILNRALPEVATAYVQYGTITEKVRGNGVVVADDPYKVVMQDSRTIKSVAVKVGDEVTKDQIMFYLEDSESEEFKNKEEEVEAKEDEIDAKQQELNQETLSYMTALLSVDISDPAFHNIQSDNIASVTAYQAQIEASRQKVENAQNTVDSLNRQILISSMDSEDDIDRETELAIVTANRDDASKRMSEAEKKISDAQGVIASLGETAVDGSQGEGEEQGPSSLEVKALEAETAFDNASNEYSAKKDALAGVLSFDEKDYFKDNLPKGVEELSALQELASENGITTEFEDFKNAYDAYLTAKDSRKAARQNLKDYNNAKSTLNSAKADLKNATDEYNSYQAKIDSLNKKSTQSEGENKELQNNLKVALDDAEQALKAAQEEQDQLLKDIGSELALSSKSDDINKVQKELAELKEELAEIKVEYSEIQQSLTDATVTAPVGGTVVSIDKVAGESTVAQEAIATIQMAGKGMTFSFSVTNAQAAKVNVGDKAELQNAWYYNDLIITLSKIKPDPEDPGKKKLLEFTVEGMVQNGENLSVSVGEKSAQYDHVVPNSAIREDNKGKFILIIDEKSTPFGNRYKARRVDAEVLASDEINTAISADLQGYEYVITTANQPVEAGEQVRLNG